MCVLGTSVAHLRRWCWSLNYCRVQYGGRGQGTGVGNIGLDEEAVVDMVGTSCCFHVIIVLGCC